MTIKLLAITNCLDCPYHKEIRDPGSDDSFDMVDTSILCTKMPEVKPTDWKWKHFGFKYVSASERPWRHRKYCDIPKWCPLGSVTEKEQNV